jgi:uncharacterized protein YjiS (DUF1127 family)
MVKLTNEDIEKQKEVNRIIRYWEGKKKYAQMRIDENLKKYFDITAKRIQINEKKIVESHLKDLGLNEDEIDREIENNDYDYENLGCYAIGSIYDTCKCKKCREEEE